MFWLDEMEAGGADKPDSLEIRNAHPRDEYIEFDEEPHIYTIKGNSDYISVTEWNDSHFKQLDKDHAIDKMFKSEKWKCCQRKYGELTKEEIKKEWARLKIIFAESGYTPKHYSNSFFKYYGMTRDEIKEQWDKIKEKALKEGTRLHFSIECFYNSIYIEDKSIEYGYFLKFYKLHWSMISYRTEWRIYDEELKIAGSIDMIFKNLDGTLEMYDWKRSKEIKMENKWQSAKTECIKHLPDCNYWHYVLQLNTYREIIERNYGMKVTGMYIVCFHPDYDNYSFKKYKIVDMRKEVQALFELRKIQLKPIQSAEVE